LIGAVFAVCLSSYPIIFFGKSYVSPGYGAQMLYDSLPFVPGYQSTDMEDLPADVGAMPWQNLPYSRVQHEAVFRHGEFPLWNRYNSAGLPLFGQGQSQILDPLQWIAVVGEGNGWAWDLKFLLSKLVFLAGIGACVFLMTRNRVATFVVTISAAFIGFFYFRFNHPIYFNLTYAPWVFYGYLQWVRMIELSGRLYLRKRQALPVVGIFVASTLLLFGGTPKEAIILFGALHVAGLAGLIITSRGSRDLVRNVGVLILLWTSIALVSAPHWLMFLDTLSKASTISDISNCNFASRPWQFVDTLFVEQQTKPWAGPTVNTFIFVSGLGVLVAVNRWYRQSYFWMVLLPLFGLLGVAYGVVPNSICRQIPLIGSIHHIHTTFFTAALVFAILLAGLGMASFLSDLKHDQGRIKWLGYGVLVLILMTWWAYPYYGTYEKATSMAGGLAIISIGGTVLLLFVAVWFYRSGQSWSQGAVICMVGLFVLIHSYHGLHMRTDIIELDNLLINPTPRADLLQPSPAIALLHGQNENQYIVLTDRSKLIEEVLQIARYGGGSEKAIVSFEDDLRSAIRSSPDGATASAHVKHYLRGVGVRPEVFEAVSVVDELPETSKMDFTERQMEKFSREPYRVIGEGWSPMSGFYSFLHLESLNGPDALMNHRYMELLDSLDWLRHPGQNWFRTLKSKDIEKLAPLFDFLNVGYFLSYRKDLNVFHLLSNTTTYQFQGDSDPVGNGLVTMHLKHHPTVSEDRVGCASNALIPDRKFDNVFSLEIHMPDYHDDFAMEELIVSAMSLGRTVPPRVNHTGGPNFVLGVSQADPTSSLLNDENGEVAITIDSETKTLWLFGCADSFDQPGADYWVRVAIERVPKIKRIHQSDMSVWSRKSPWPRAYFVDSFAAYTKLAELANFVRQAEGIPFAALATGQVVEPRVNRIVVAARNYRLTSNTTSFHVNAPTAGVVVLSEVDIPGDVHVRLNNKASQVFTINHVFRGVEIPEAGHYEITFTYRPKVWTVALLLSVSGCFVLMIIVIFLLRKKRVRF